MRKMTRVTHLLAALIALGACVSSPKKKANAPAVTPVPTQSAQRVSAPDAQRYQSINDGLPTCVPQVGGLSASAHQAARPEQTDSDVAAEALVKNLVVTSRSLLAQSSCDPRYFRLNTAASSWEPTGLEHHGSPGTLAEISGILANVRVLPGHDGPTYLRLWSDPPAKQANAAVWIPCTARNIVSDGDAFLVSTRCGIWRVSLNGEATHELGLSSDDAAERDTSNRSSSKGAWRGGFAGALAKGASKIPKAINESTYPNNLDIRGIRRDVEALIASTHSGEYWVRNNRRSEWRYESADFGADRLVSSPPNEIFDRKTKVWIWDEINFEGKRWALSSKGVIRFE